MFSKIDPTNKKGPTLLMYNVYDNYNIIVIIIHYYYALFIRSN